jgi:hypothetical protein
MPILAALVVLPMAFTQLGFVLASTLLFALTAAAMRGRPTRLGVDLLIGLVFAAVMFVIFTRGLAVSLPTPRLF